MKMFHLDNKGFAMAGVLYPLLILFLMLLLGTLGTLMSRKIILDKTKKEVQQSLNDSSTYNYVSNGLVAHYDGYVGAEKVGNDFVWKDQSASNIKGMMTGFSIPTAFKEGALEFTGTQYVKLQKLNYSQITIEAVVKPSAITSSATVVGNIENGGYGIEYNHANKTFTFQVNVNGSNISGTTNPYGVTATNAGVMRYLSGSYNGKSASFFQDGEKHAVEKSGAIQTSGNNTVMMIGANPTGSQPENNYFKGRIYSVRIYNRALTDEEVKHNYNVDKKRFGIFE